MRAAVGWGAATAVLLAFPLAALCALVYRFPVPFAGYESGPAAVPRALLAVLFYGAVGGIPALLAAGALGGWLAHRIARPDGRRVRRLAIAAGGAAALVGVIALAVLDLVIGPW